MFVPLIRRRSNSEVENTIALIRIFVVCLPPMADTDAPKKAAQGRSSRNHPPAEDWHPADVQAALKKRGKTFRGLSKELGFKTHWIAQALYQPSPIAEGIIAEVLDLHPKQIWPSRYDHAGQPKTRIKRGRIVPKNIPARAGRHAWNGGPV